jgi:hypothetical protein
MDMYAKLSRALMRRKYEKVDRSTTRSARNSLGFVVKRKSVTVKLPKAEKGQKKKRVDAASEPLPIVNPRLFTILSSANDVVDEAWLIAALRRALDEGRLNILMKENPQSSPSSSPNL